MSAGRLFEEFEAGLPDPADRVKLRDVLTRMKMTLAVKAEDERRVDGEDYKKYKAGLDMVYDYLESLDELENLKERCFKSDLSDADAVMDLLDNLCRSSE